MNALENDVNTLKKEGFIGFFKKLQEERIKELREEILMEMGLTEEDLGRMDPEQRSVVEKMIAREIQQRMAAGTAMDQEDNDNPTPGLFFGGQILGTASGLGTDGGARPWGLNNTSLEQGLVEADFYLLQAKAVTR
ncbi:MAG: hypothetical protein HUK40_09320 [Desulfobacter sp.]|nr:hypothetical protein [Desulfobacter sp.]